MFSIGFFNVFLMFSKTCFQNKVATSLKKKTPFVGNYDKIPSQLSQQKDKHTRNLPNSPCNPSCSLGPKARNHVEMAGLSHVVTVQLGHSDDAVQMVPR